MGIEHEIKHLDGAQETIEIMITDIPTLETEGIDLKERAGMVKEKLDTEGATMNPKEKAQWEAHLEELKRVTGQREALGK